MTARERLPNRRRHEVVAFDHGGFAYVAGVGRFEDGRPAEVFLGASAKSGTMIEAAARDAAVVTSIALQYGAPADVIQRALTRDSDSRASGPIGALLDLLLVDDGAAR